MYKTLEKYTKKIRYIDIKNIFKIIIGLIFTGKLIVEGLNTGNFLTKAMKDIEKENKVYNIKQLKMLVVIPAVDLKNGKLFVFSSKEVRRIISDEIKFITDAPLDIVVRSSCSYPGVFSPCKYKGIQLVDGGVRENLAWKELKDIGADKVLRNKLRYRSCIRTML